MAAAGRREERGGGRRGSLRRSHAPSLEASGGGREEDVGQARARQEAPDRFAAAAIATQWPWLPACLGSSALAAHIVWTTPVATGVCA